MSMQDPIADMLTRIRNAQAAHKEFVIFPSSQMKAAICQVLREEGYLASCDTEEQDGKQSLKVHLRYHEGSPVIQHLQRSSRPGLRNYEKCEKLPRVRNGLGVSVISTSQGVMSDHAARAFGLGGEVLCTVF